MSAQFTPIWTRTVQHDGRAFYVSPNNFGGYVVIEVVGRVPVRNLKTRAAVIAKATRSAFMSHGWPEPAADELAMIYMGQQEQA
jgi:hypothetical protein